MHLKKSLKQIFVDARAAVAANVWLVTLTKACEQTNTPNTHAVSSITCMVWFAMHGVVSELSSEVGFD